MTLEDAFLRAIAEAPDDDTPRLVYADWLTDQGDPRGEFIHVQCTLGRMSADDPCQPDLYERERELLALHQEAWLGPLRPHLRRWTFRRGFLDAVAMRPAAYLAQWPSSLLPPSVHRVEVDLTGIEVPGTAIELMPESVAREKLLMPLGFRGTTYVLAMPEGWDEAVLQKFAYIFNRDVEPVAASRDQIIEAINRHYHGPIESFDSCFLSTS